VLCTKLKYKEGNG